MTLIGLIYNDKKRNFKSSFIIRDLRYLRSIHLFKTTLPVFSHQQY
jgi:hypothetical protein